MPVPTTARFQFLESNSLVQELYIGESPTFSTIRLHMQRLYSALYHPEGDVYQNEAALMLRFETQKWLTSPLMPDIGLFLRCGLADDGWNRRKWGGQTAQTVELLKDLISRYADEGSVLNAEFVRLFVELAGEYAEDRIRIWCHRKERDLFRDLLEGLTELDDGMFISTLAEYRKSPPTDVLIRFGPLRTCGFGNVPEALITSPSYSRLVRLIWAGLVDEEGFADDPVLPTHNHLSNLCSVRTIVTGDSEMMTVLAETEPTDDLVFFDWKAPAGKDLHRCVLVEFPAGYGVLLRPGSRLLVFRPHCTDAEAIGYRHIGDVEASDYLLIHDADADLGGVSVDAAKAPLAALWKKALADAWRRHSGVCIQRMQHAGINLQDLSRAVQKWTAMNGTVIRAPLRKSHFEALLTKVLDPDLIPPVVVDGRTTPGWRRAWAEVESSRVTAIQHGAVENAIVNEQLVAELRKELPAIRDMISLDDIYRHLLQPVSGLTGCVAFKPVISFSADFAAPVEQLDKLLKLPVAELYRVGPGGDHLCV
ncbi:hypothetical protein [Pseudomonas chlororaphis]|uniref:hypothetical protein n=1 Tax=Pseudomonas chlororaphis TaxID=587753 RepID=UPI000F55BCF9|nr:hypothetical protein [Pseudomonas chlororaphis]AZD79036.1 hypothetical protein C4K15_2469 [Pseudomonas chlororaphis subsp. aurantiaca]